MNGAVARRRLPAARFVSLPGVGHVPMIDDPDAVAAVILATTGVVPPLAAAASFVDRPDRSSRRVDPFGGTVVIVDRVDGDTHAGHVQFVDDRWLR